MELPVARVVRQDGDVAYVLCPYCCSAHKHGGVVPGDVRGSDCEQVGRSGEYTIGPLIPVSEIALAIKHRNRDVKRKAELRAKSKDLDKSAKNPGTQ